MAEPSRLRPIQPEEFDDYWQVLVTAFGEDEGPEEKELWRQQTEFERTVAVFEGSRMVATGGNATFELTVPRGSVPMGGVTAISVLPSHRRRGLLKSVVRHLLDEAGSRSEPVAGLWASEAGIYGRFGFGWAATGLRMSLETRHATFLSPANHHGKVRMIDVEEALTALPPIYDQVRRRVPGMLDRSAGRWGFLEVDPESSREGAGPRFQCVLEDRGYVLYRVQSSWTPTGPDHTLVVEELVAVDEVAEALLWRWCLDMDLVGTLTAAARPADDALPLLLADPRRVAVSTQDTLWLCVLDVPAALSARRYPVDGVITFAVVDAFVPGVDGIYRLEVHDGVATCQPVDARPDFSLGAAELGAAYLGGTRLQRLRRAGRVNEHSPGTVASADVMLSSQPLPWCPWEF